MEISHLGIVILSAILATGNAQKGIYCVDPHTGLYYPVNSTWPSSTFCGTYTCNAKLISKDNTTQEFDSIPFLESTIQNEDNYGKNYEVGISFEDLEDEPKEDSGENVQDENNDFSKTIENVLQASKELTEISGEIHDIAKHVRLYKAANDLLKSLKKTENVDRLSTEDTEKLLEALTNSVVKNESDLYKEDGLDTADTLNIYHNMNHKDSTSSSNIAKSSKKSMASLNEPFYDVDSISPYFSYYPSYFYSSPLYQSPYLNDLSQPVNTYVSNESSDDNDINASNLNENYQMPNTAQQNVEKNNHHSLHHPFPSIYSHYSDQNINFPTTGRFFPGYNIPITPIQKKYLPKYSKINSQHNLVNKYNRNENHNTDNHDYNSHFNYVNNHHHHHHGIEKTERYHHEKSTYENMQKHKTSYNNFERDVNDTPYQYYPFNYEGPNHKAKDIKSNIAYYYYDPMKNEYTMNIPRNYSDYESYYKDFMQKHPNIASPSNGNSNIMTLEEYYKKYYSNEQKGLLENSVNGEDSRQTPTPIREVPKKPEGKIHPMEYTPNVGQGIFGKKYLSHPTMMPTEYLKLSESKDTTSSDDRKILQSNKNKMLNSRGDENDEYKMTDSPIQWKSGNSNNKDFKLRVSSKSADSSEETSTEYETDNDAFLGTYLGSKIIKPGRLLNLNPFTTLKSKQGLRRISKRSLNYSLSEKDTKNGRRKWRSYITVQGCPESLEPGYFRSGDATKNYPYCCPQKIPN